MKTTAKADWEMLRDEIAAKDLAEQQEIWDKLKPLMELPSHPQSSYMGAETDRRLADLMEMNYTHLILKKHLTKDIVERYADFFDRTGLETDLDKYMTEVHAEWDRKASYGDSVPPVSPEEQRKTICREFRRDLGDQLRKAREKKGYSLRSVEEYTGISKKIISRTELGRANTTIDTIALLCRHYGIYLELN